MATADLLRIWPSKVLTVSYLLPVAEGFSLWLKSLGSSWTGIESLKPVSKYEPVCCWVLSGAREQRACVWDNRAFTNGPLQQPCMGKAGQAPAPPSLSAAEQNLFCWSCCSTFQLSIFVQQQQEQPASEATGSGLLRALFLRGSICLSVYISVEDSGFRVKEVTCLSVLFCFVCQLWIVENGLECPGWDEEARFIFNKTCSRKRMPNW